MDRTFLARSASTSFRQPLNRDAREYQQYCSRIRGRTRLKSDTSLAPRAGQKCVQRLTAPLRTARRCAMISTMTKLGIEQIYSEMLECTDNCETFSLKRRIISLRRRQFVREERDGALDSTAITLQHHGAYCDVLGVYVKNNRLLEVGMRESAGCTQATLDFFK